MREDRLKNAKEAIIFILETLKKHLSELDNSSYNHDLFVQGEFLAYLDCLRLVLAWNGADKTDLMYDDLDITKRHNGLRILPSAEFRKKSLFEDPEEEEPEEEFAEAADKIFA